MGFNPEVPPISQSNFNFSSVLLQELPQNGNLVFSPFSLALVMLMARFGAHGQTAAQIENALRLPQIQDMADLVPIRQEFFKILKQMGTPSEDYTATVANRMFVEKGFRINNTFRKISKTTLNVTVRAVNFADGLNASETINSWVREETNGKINELFQPDSFSSDTKLVLANAVYFKSPWKYPFEAGATRRLDFHAGKRPIRVMTMVSEDEFSYGHVSGLSAKVVSLPYKGDRFSMQVIIPTEPNGLGSMLEQLKDTTMRNIRLSLKAPGNCEKVRLHLPRFQIQSSHSLVQPLQKMGVTDMFQVSKADFSGILLNPTNVTKLFVSEVIQKASISVDEEGTEAAAASGIRAGVTCSPTVTEIKADRPFYYQIVEDATNTVLFAGVVRNANV